MRRPLDLPLIIVFHCSNHYKWCQEEFEDTKEVTRIRISKKNRQHNGQK